MIRLITLSLILYASNLLATVQSTNVEVKKQLTCCGFSSLDWYKKGNKEFAEITTKTKLAKAALTTTEGYYQVEFKKGASFDIEGINACLRLANMVPQTNDPDSLFNKESKAIFKIFDAELPNNESRSGYINGWKLSISRFDNKSECSVVKQP